jgi:hypothetical protein
VSAGDAPISLRIGDELYDRVAPLPNEGAAGVPYARRADAGGVRLLVHVVMLPCPTCGAPLFLVDEGRAANQGPRQYRCGSTDCLQTWRLVLTSEPGKARTLALVKERH